MLCALRFVSAKFRYFGAVLPIRACADNQPMIRSCVKRRAYRRPFASTTLATDFDLLEAIHSVSHEWQLTFEHVKGHKDEYVTFNKLPLDAQLNVEADEWATRSQHSGYNALVLPSSVCRAAVNLRGATLTGKYHKSCY
jgi:hypothetical protein